MKCDEPGCTGVHSHTRPPSEWCPRTRRRAAALRDAWKAEHPGRHYLQQLKSQRAKGNE